MNNQKDYFNKYLKYKLKYLDLKSQDQNGGFRRLFGLGEITSSTTSSPT